MIEAVEIFDERFPVLPVKLEIKDTDVSKSILLQRGAQIHESERRHTPLAGEGVVMNEGNPDIFLHGDRNTVT
jgi:hypothetical protein